MRLLVPALIATSAVLIGCSGDDALDTGNFRGGDNYVDKDLEPEMVVDSMKQVGVPAVDVLWVVDNSLSMYEEQRALTNNFTSFMRFFEESPLGLDYHIGVVTTGYDSEDEKGKLRTALDHRGDVIRWIDPEVRNSYDAFREMALIGTDGPLEEKGRAQVYQALETLGGTENFGFMRDDAYLSVIVLSDEDDRSGETPIGLDGFIDWMKTVKGSPEQVTFSSIVSPEGGCGGLEEAADYLNVTKAVGGVVHPICEPSWATVMEDLGLSAAGLRDEFPLSRRPNLDAGIDIEVKAPRKEAVSYTIGLNVKYVPERNVIAFTNSIPDPEAIITISYEAAAN